MSNPSWFNEAYFLNSKLAQLQASGQTQYTNVAQVYSAIVAAGQTPLENFLQFSLVEGTDPDQYFDTVEYLEAKAVEMGLPQTDYPYVSVLLQQAGFTSAYAHYNTFGWLEGVNPNNDFDTDTYIQDLADLNGITFAQATAALQAANLNPVSHYYYFGQSEGLVPSPAVDPVDPPVGETYTLTTGVDVITYAGSNTVGYGVIADTTSTGASTLQVFDRFGMTGSNNTLNATLVATGVMTSATTPILNGVNTLNVMSTVATTTSSLAGGIAPNLTTLNIVSPAGAVTFNAIPVAVANIGLSNVAADNADTTFTFAAGTSGAANAINLALSNNSAAATTTPANFAVVDINGSAAGQGFEIVNVTATGTNRLDDLTVNSTGATDSMEVLNISGAGSLRVNTALSFANTSPVINASANTGGVNLGIGGTNNATFIGGAGNDRISFAAAAFNTADSVDGGAGVNTLAIADTTLNAAQTGLVAAINAADNIQVIEMTGATATLAANAVAQTEFLISGATGAVSVTAVNGDTITLSSGATTVSIAGSTGVTSLDFNLLNAGTAAGGTTLDLTGFNTVNLDSSLTAGTAANVFTGLVTNNANAEFTVTGNAGLTVLNAGAAAFSAAVNFNGAANTGIQQIAGSGSADLITSGINNDTLLGYGGNDTINGGAGNDTITAGVGKDVVNGGDGIDNFIVAATDSLATGISGTNALTASYITTNGTAYDAYTVTVGDTITSAASLGALSNQGTSIPNVGDSFSAATASMYWNDGTNTYVLTDIGVAGVIDATDQLIVINGVHTLSLSATVFTVLS